MSERRKFQRRKKTAEQAAPEARPVDAHVQPASSSRPQAGRTSTKTPKDIQDLLARKEELLRRKEQLEREKTARKTTKSEVPGRSKRPNRDESKPRSTPQKPLVLGTPPDDAPRQATRPAPAIDPWDQMDRFPLDGERLDRKNIVTALRENPSYARFDVLRTRMIQALAENGWRRIAITSPSPDSGKSFVAANLVISLSRQDNCPTVLLDLDMRKPSLHRIFDIRDPGAISDFLTGKVSATRQLQRIGANDIQAHGRVAIGFNGVEEPFAAELLQDTATETTLRAIEDSLNPTVVLFDMPPALLNDDVLAMRPHFDAILLVVGGGQTTARDIKEVERRLGDDVPLLGIVLNRSDDDLGDLEAY